MKTIDTSMHRANFDVDDVQSGVACKPVQVDVWTDLRRKAWAAFGFFCIGWVCSWGFNYQLAMPFLTDHKQLDPKLTYTFRNTLYPVLLGKDDQDKTVSIWLWKGLGADSEHPTGDAPYKKLLPIPEQEGFGPPFVIVNGKPQQIVK